MFYHMQYHHHVRAVLDTSILVAAIRSSRGASNLLLRACLERKLTPVVSVPLFLEYEAVLTRDDHLQSSGLTHQDVQTLLDALVNVSEPVRLAFSWRPAVSDPEDDMVLETAVNANVGLLITFHLRDFAAAATRFGLAVVSPKQALSSLGMDR